MPGQSALSERPSPHRLCVASVRAPCSVSAVCLRCRAQESCTGSCYCISDPPLKKKESGRPLLVLCALNGPQISKVLLLILL